MDDVSFSIDEGETFAIVGESGSGKTTISRMILQLEPKTSGKVFSRGKDIDAMTAEEKKECRQSVQAVDMLGIEYPIFSFSHCRNVAAVVSNAGGFGVLGATTMEPDEIRVEFEWLRKNCNKPFGMDLMLPQASPESGTHEDLMKKIPRENIEYMDKLRKELGLPDGYIPRRPSSNVTIEFRSGATLDMQKKQLDTICALKPQVLSLVGNVKQARRVAEYGVDIIVAQGTEAGGHTGRIATMVLVPLVVDAFKPIPVLAAGGIADGRGLVASLALGAVGVWTGTIWLTAHEHPLEDFLKDKILAATEEDTVIQRYLTGKPVRALKNKFFDYWEKPGAPKPLPAPYQSMYLPIPPFVTTEWSDQTWKKLGLQDWIGGPAGQIVGMLKERRSARQIVYDMVSQAAEILGD